jgi:hypothetical protein
MSVFEELGALVGVSVNRVLRAFSLCVASATASCASVDQFGSRVYDGNVNVQGSINQEVLLNIIRASRYQSVSWNPVNQVSGGQTEALSTGLPTINIGPHQTAAQGVYSISNSLSSTVNSSYQTAPLLSTNFQSGMLTPVDLKTFALLAAYYPRETIFYSLIAAVDVNFLSTHQTARLANDPAQDYVDIYHPSVFDQRRCYEIATGKDNKAHLFPGTECSYSKFTALMSTLIELGLYTELVEYATNTSAQSSPIGAPLSQTTMVSQGRFCFSNILRPNQLKVVGLPTCGEKTKPQALGGNVVVTRTETHKSDDVIVTTDTKSAIDTITSTRNSLLPIKDQGHFSANYPGVGSIEISFELRSPDGFLNYLGSWYNYGDKVAFPGYDSISAQRIFGNGPYLSISDTQSGRCYSTISYDGASYCVPMEATHTAMLMDIAVILRNLNVQPSDLNAPFTVRLAD